jgi:predicted TIM-barrel fold metal-dependent hydrolase
LPTDAVAILDSHCHAWRRWPYQPPVPDEEQRGSSDQLIFEMDANGIGQALVVCASIDENPDNLDYVADACRRHPSRLQMVADLDCVWSDTYHAPGSAARLADLCDRYALAGFTHYLGDRNDGWLRSDDAHDVFTLASQRGLIVSLGADPCWQADLRLVASRHPDVAVLCNSLGGIWVGPEGTRGLEEVLASAAVTNIHLKLAGFHYACADGWDYPWQPTMPALERIYEAYGPRRFCWGSDFPAATRFCTYRQSLEVVRTHCRFIAPRDLPGVLGGNLRRLLAPA